MTPNQIMRDLARDDILPKAAMAEAGARREEMLPIFVDLVNRLARQSISEMADSDMMALNPVFHLLGEWQDHRAYRPLLQLLRCQSIDHLLGDTLTETSFRVIAGTFDGDLQPMFDGIEDKKAYEYARNSLMRALVLIAQLHPYQRPAIEDYVRTFSNCCSNAPTIVYVSWMNAVVVLALEDMTEAVREVFDKGLIPDSYCNFGDFLEDLEATLKAGGPATSRDDELSLISDAIDELSGWYCYSDTLLNLENIRQADNILSVAPWTEHITKMPNKLGRNDPCYCGSGKKFKKCCLH